MFFDSWRELGRVLLVGVLAYAALVLLLRISGNRTLSKLNAFDLIVTVSLGSTLATVLLSKDVALAEGVLAFAVLIGLQFLVTWTSVRVRWFNKLVKSEPLLVFHQGRFLPKAMRRARLVEEEVLAKMREQGVARRDAVEAVVLETDGSLTVLQRPDEPPDTLSSVKVPGLGEGARPGVLA